MGVGVSAGLPLAAQIAARRSYYGEGGGGSGGALIWASSLREGTGDSGVEARLEVEAERGSGAGGDWRFRFPSHVPSTLDTSIYLASPIINIAIILIVFLAPATITPPDTECSFNLLKGRACCVNNSIQSFSEHPLA